jgi:2-iminoacetate synthase ThiH
MIYDTSPDELLQKVWDGGRIDQAEALRLYDLPLEELGALAECRRQIAKDSAKDQSLKRQTRPID